MICIMGWSDTSTFDTSLLILLSFGMNLFSSNSLIFWNNIVMSFLGKITPVISSCFFDLRIENLVWFYSQELSISIKKARYPIDFIEAFIPRIIFVLILPPIAGGYYCHYYDTYFCVRAYNVNHFQPMLHFYNPGKHQKKHQKNGVFLIFSGVLEVEHWLKMG